MDFEEPGAKVHQLRPQPPRRPIRVWRVVLIAAAFVLFIAVGKLLTFYVDWLWFGEIGQRAVLIKMVGAQLGLLFGAAILFWLIVVGNVWLAKRLAPGFVISFNEEIIHLDRSDLEKYLVPLVGGIVALISFVVGISASENWEMVLKYLNQVPFGKVDPVFAKDVGFYVFSLPVWRYAVGFGISLVILTFFATAAVYVLLGALRIEDKRPVLSSQAVAHLSVLAAIGFALYAVRYQIQAYKLVLSDRGVVFGATYTDIHAQLPAFKLLVAIAAIAAIAMIVNIFLRRLVIPAAAIAALLAVSLVAGSIYPALVQSYRVEPDEVNKERPYIKRNIEFTRDAYNLAKVDSRPFPAELTLTPSKLKANDDTIRNIRLWDWRPLIKTYTQLQAIRPNYVFPDVDIDRYTIDGLYRQVAVAAREMSVDALQERVRTWINEHLVFTHGLGIVMSPVNVVEEEGLPAFFIRDIPPRTTTNVRITQPRIYFGESTKSYAIVRTKTAEFDYPKGDENVYTRYSGSGGILMNSLLRKVAFALRGGDIQILLSGSITPQSKIIVLRDVKARLEYVAPFLRYDADPYMTVVGGRLYWIVDGYTMTKGYPYSEPYNDDFNYIRNPVKAVVDAYNGTTSFYVVDKTDPMIKTYMAAFPTLFKPYSEMPAGLRAHVRYPEDYFTVQAWMYATYHMNDPQVFYRKEDRWSIPEEIADEGRTQMQPYYVIMKLPGGRSEEFVLIQPYTPNNRTNMVAWLAARIDGGHYGELVVFKFPRGNLVYGPMQIEARIDQTPSISQQLTLLNQRGSRVIRGNLLVIPIEQSLLYVEPLYLQAEQSELPELKKVVVAYGNRVVMEDNLGAALTSLFAVQLKVEEPGKPGRPQAKATRAELIEEANRHFEAAQKAARDGDWGKYGEEIKKLGETLRRLREQSP